MIYDTLCLSGGGIDGGFSIIGSIKYLSDKNIINLEQIVNFIGTSAGSIICLLILVGYDTDTIIKILYKLDLDKIKIDLDLDCLLESYGIDNGCKIITVIQTLLYNKIGNYDITFQELFKITNKNLKILVVNYTKQEEQVLSYQTTPDMSVILAVRMSMSIPFIFTPVKHNNELYIDGGITNNFGLEYCNINKTVGICVHFKMSSNNENKVENILEYLNGLLCLLLKNTTIKNKSENIIIIDCHWEIDNYNPDKNRKLKLFRTGYQKTKYICENSINFISTKIVNNIINNALIQISKS